MSRKQCSKFSNHSRVFKQTNLAKNYSMPPWKIWVNLGKFGTSPLILTNSPDAWLWVFLNWINCLVQKLCILIWGTAEGGENNTVHHWPWAPSISDKYSDRWLKKARSFLKTPGIPIIACFLLYKLRNTCVWTQTKWLWFSFYPQAIKIQPHCYNLFTATNFPKTLFLNVLIWLLFPFCPIIHIIGWFLCTCNYFLFWIHFLHTPKMHLLLIGLEYYTLCHYTYTYAIALVFVYYLIITVYNI